jgi:hypothetical protein
MSSLCYQQDCSAGCCNRYGYCPDYTSYDYYANTCYHYYSNAVSLTTGAVVGLVVGLVVFFVALGLGIFFCCRRRRMLAMQAATTTYPNDNTTIILPTQNQPAYGMTQMAQPYGGQPYGGQPYGQPYVQPYGAPNSYGQQGGY